MAWWGEVERGGEKVLSLRKPASSGGPQVLHSGGGATSQERESSECQRKHAWHFTSIRKKREIGRSKEKLHFRVRTQQSEQAHQWCMLDALQQQSLGKLSTLCHQGKSSLLLSTLSSNEAHFWWGKISGKVIDSSRKINSEKEEIIVYSVWVL